MKPIARLTLFLGTLLSCLPLVSFSFEGNGDLANALDNSQMSQSTSNLENSLNNLGLYIGFDLSGAAPTPPSTTTPDLNAVVSTEFGSGVSYVSAFPLLVNVEDAVTIVPSSVSSSYPTPYQILTTLPASPYSVWSNFNSPSTSLISVVSGVDQPVSTSNNNNSYLSDIVSQSIYDALTTADYTYCTSSNDNTTLINSSCSYQNNYQVANAILNGGSTTSGSSIIYGTDLPTYQQVVSASYNQPLVPLLNANTLLVPMMYNTTPPSNEEEESGEAATPGYPTETQAVQAADFARYLSGQNLLGTLANYNTYNALVSNVASSTPSTQNGALAQFYNYLMGLRTYAANLSVGVSNLSAILGKRMQNSATKTSQAFDEYVMATRRVLDPSSQPSSGQVTNAWVADMEKAAPITMQREMLYLLAEINYQLYLSRQQDERILLTLTALELQGVSSMKNTLSVAAGSSSTSSTSTSTTTGG